MESQTLKPAQFLLPDGEVAFYEWGTYSVNLAPSVGHGKDTIPWILVGLSDRRAFWWNDSDFKRGVAILHECVHCLQDLTTGVGLWDFMLRMDSAAGILREWRKASYSVPFGAPVPTGERPSYGQWLDSGFVPQSVEASRRRLAYLNERSTAALQISLEETDAFSIARLLEAEAVVQVHLILARLAMSDHQHRIMFEQRSLWSAPDMAELYQGVYHDVIDLLRGWARADGIDLDGNGARLALTLTAMLIEISLAHPSPDFAAQSKLDIRDYDPGLKFVMLLAALAGLPLAEHNAVMTSIGDWNLAEAERLLLARCAIPYPHSLTIYADWIDRLEQRDGDDRRIGLRLRALRQRLAQKSGVIFKSPDTFFLFGLPLIIVSDGGFRLTSTNPEYTLGDTRFELIADIAREQAVTRLFSSAIEGAPFVCSHAEFGICSARTRHCREGISSAGDFPADDQCAVRRMLEDNYFGTFKPIFVTPPNNE